MPRQPDFVDLYAPHTRKPFKGSRDLPPSAPRRAAARYDQRTTTLDP